MRTTVKARKRLEAFCSSRVVEGYEEKRSMLAERRRVDWRRLEVDFGVDLIEEVRHR